MPSGHLPHSPRFDVVRARPLLAFDDLVRDLGGDPQGLRRQAGLCPHDGDAGDPLTYRQLAGLLERAAAACRCPDFGMRLAHRQGGQALFGPLGDAVRNAGTLGEALQCVTTYSHAHSPAAGIWLRRSPRAQATMVGHDILIDGLPYKAQLIEMILLTGQLMIAELTQGFARPQRVLLRHQPLSPPVAYRRFFQCEVRFGQAADALVLDDRALACPIAAPDAENFRAAVAYIEERFAGQGAPFHARVRGVVTHFIGTDECSKERIAGRFGMHARTLHRRLAREGTSFQRIKDEVRRDLLLYCIARTDFDLSRIAERLGFAEQAVLSRFCRKWFACSPTALRGQAGFVPNRQAS